MNLIEQINRSRKLMGLNEVVEDIHDLYELHDELVRDIFYAIKNKEAIRFKTIPANQYQNALREFVRYGQFMRFPVRYIHIWKERIFTNISKLEILTSIVGHTNSFPFDEFHDTFDYNRDTDESNDGEFSKWWKDYYGEDKDLTYDWETAYNFLNKVYNMDDTLPLFSNGQWLLSDFGLKPLWKLANELVEKKTPEEIIIVINKILDVSHQRSDLAEIFIEGGSTSLDAISK